MKDKEIFQSVACDEIPSREFIGRDWLLFDLLSFSSSYSVIEKKFGRKEEKSRIMYRNSLSKFENWIIGSRKEKNETIGIFYKWWEIISIFLFFFEKMLFGPVTESNLGKKYNFSSFGGEVNWP
jgi:hypothetical protein